MSKLEKNQPRLDSETLTNLSKANFVNLAKMDAFLSDGLKEIDLNTQCLHRQKVQLEAPSLVVSTSNAVMPLSLESTTDLKKASSLAHRRGKEAPGRLKIRMQREEEILDYPEVPTAFRGTPSTETLVFPLPPTVTVEGVKLTAEQMIASLRAQISSLKVQSVEESSFLDQCGDAEGWLDSEVDRYREEEAWNRATKGISGPTKLKPPALHGTTRLRSATESVTKESSLFGRTVLGMTRFGYGLNKENDQKGVPATLPRSGMRRATISTSSESEKRVRFSVGPPVKIPYDILDKSTEHLPGVGLRAPQASPPKRKPPPPLPTLTKKSTGSSLPSPTLSVGSSKTAYSNHSPAFVSRSLPSLRRRASDIAMPVMPIVVEENNVILRTSLDGYGSAGARPKMRMGDILGSKKKTDENAGYEVRLKGDGDLKMVKEKPRSRMLPFQNVLNRLRG